MSTATTTFAALLAQRGRSAGAPELRAQRRGLIPLAIAGGIAGAWMVAAPLSGAIIAAGKLKVELNRKTVQHQEGGIVSEILVRDGERVRKGQPLIVVGDVRSDAELNLLQDQLRAEQSAKRVPRRKRRSTTSRRRPSWRLRPSPSTSCASSAVQRAVAPREQIASLEAQIRDARRRRRR